MFVGARRLFVTGLAGLLLGASAVACSGSGDRPRTLPPLSTTPAASASTAPSTQQDELAAMTFVVHGYFALLNGRTTVANASALAALMAPDCSCRQVANSTRRLANRGEHYYGKTTVVSLVPALDGPAAGDVLVTYDYERSGIARNNGTVVTSYPGRHGASVDVRLRLENGVWRITALIYVRKGTP